MYPVRDYIGYLIPAFSTNTQPQFESTGAGGIAKKTAGHFYTHHRTPLTWGGLRKEGTPKIDLK